MEVNEEVLSFVNIGGGAAVEAFDLAFQKVLKDIMDLSTQADKVREITLKVKFKTDKYRGLVGFGIQCTPKLAPTREIMSQFVLERKDTRLVVRELLQGNLFDAGNVVNLVEREEENASC